MSKGVAFEMQHFKDIELRPKEERIIGRNQYGFHKLAALETMGIVNTLIEQETVVAIYGYVQLWEGTYECYVLPSIHVAKHSILFVKELLEWIDILENSLPMRRLQSNATADPMHDRFMRTLGFECEGTMRKFLDNGTDYRLWAKVY